MVTVECLPVRVLPMQAEVTDEAFTAMLEHCRSTDSPGAREKAFEVCECVFVFVCVDWPCLIVACLYGSASQHLL